MDKWWRGSQYGEWRFPLIHKQFFTWIIKKKHFYEWKWAIMYQNISSIENHQDYIHVKEKELRNELINFSKIWFHSNIKPTILH